MTVKVKLYKNLDPKQLQEFTGRSMESTLAKVEQWMTANNGEWTKRNGRNPCQVDGLFFNDYTAASKIALVWDETYHEWVIDFNTDDPDDNMTFEKWENALEEFLQLLTQYGYWYIR